eukprot:3954066-Amphidinium_carterae.1
MALESHHLLSGLSSSSQSWKQKQQYYYYFFNGCFVWPHAANPVCANAVLQAQVATPTGGNKGVLVDVLRPPALSEVLLNAAVLYCQP